MKSVKSNYTWINGEMIASDSGRGWIERNTLAAPLEKFAFNMPVGRISNIIDYAGNYYIIKVEDKRGGTTRSLAEARDDIEKRLIQEEAQGIQERWIAGLRAKAYIKTF